MLFNDSILVSGLRANGRRVMLDGVRCRLVDDGLQDANADGSVMANAEYATAFIQKEEWAEVTPPQIGDKVMRSNDETPLSVYKVARLGDCWSVACRSF